MIRHGLLVGSALLVLTAPALAESDPAARFRDRHGYFELVPPEGWARRIHPDEGSKVEFFVASSFGGRSRASLIIESRPADPLPDPASAAEERAARFRQMGSQDAAIQTVDVAGARGVQVEAWLPRQNLRTRILFFNRHGRACVVTFSAAVQDFGQFVDAAEAALATFRSLPPP